jgi:predicted P-loop ATPase/GTPase
MLEDVLMLSESVNSKLRTVDPLIVLIVLIVGLLIVGSYSALAVPAFECLFEAHRIPA